MGEELDGDDNDDHDYETDNGDYAMMMLKMPTSHQEGRTRGRAA